MGLRLANLVVRDWDRTPSKRDPRLRRDVKASSGMLIRDILGAQKVSSSVDYVLFLGLMLGMLKGEGNDEGWKEPALTFWYLIS